jgi:4a-hydroxytetrahydrobiopterin dehydratase
MEERMTLLTEDQVEESLKGLAGWDATGQAIQKEFKFDDFVDAMDFVNDVAELAEDADHHPDIDIRYNEVTLTLWTHTEGGVTQRDTALAAEIERVYEDYL